MPNFFYHVLLQVTYLNPFFSAIQYKHFSCATHPARNMKLCKIFLHHVLLQATCLNPQALFQLPNIYFNLEKGERRSMIKGKFYPLFEMYRSLIWLKKPKRPECNPCLLHTLKNISVESKSGFTSIFFTHPAHKHVTINLISHHSKQY